MLSICLFFLWLAAGTFICSFVTQHILFIEIKNLLTMTQQNLNIIFFRAKKEKKKLWSWMAFWHYGTRLPSELRMTLITHYQGQKEQIIEQSLETYKRFVYISTLALTEQFKASIVMVHPWQWFFFQRSRKKETFWSLWNMNKNGMKWAQWWFD